MLDYWMTRHRNCFTRSDFEFVSSVLGHAENPQHLSALWQDDDSQREILDLKEILHAVIDHPEAIAVSPRFYFYVLVRHAFLDADLSEPELADYVSGILSRRLEPNPKDHLQNIVHGFTHAAQFLSVIRPARGKLRFHLQVAAGNQFLVLTGMYPKFLERRAEEKALPSLEYYESFARHAYRGAARGNPGYGKNSRLLLDQLADALPVARKALNRVSEEFLFLGE